MCRLQFRLNIMKFIPLIISLLFFSCNEVQNESHTIVITKEMDASPDEQLYKVFANDHFGFINSKGKVVIDIKFKDAFDFTEEYASVRLDYRFGYIDHTGEIVIEPIFDAAEPFINGFAKVYVDGSPAIIDKSGEFVVQPKIYASIDYFFDGVAIVTANSGLRGGINTKGKLVIDTIYKEISRFNNNRAVITSVNHPNDIRIREQNIGVIDTKGNIIVEFNKYFDIGKYNDGYAWVEVYNSSYDEDSGWSSEEGIIDTNGTLMFKTTNSLDRVVKQGVIKASVGYSKDIFYTINGEKILNTLPLNHLGEYSEGFVVNWDMFKYKIYKINGEELLPDTYRHISISGFKNGMIEFECDENVRGLLDTTGKILVECKYDAIHDAGLVNNRVFFRERVGDTYQYIWGLLNEKGDTILPARFTDVQYSGFETEIVYVEQDSLYGYINRDGEFVWSNVKDYNNLSAFHDLNSSKMLRAYCYVESSVADTLNNKYEWMNYPKKLKTKFGEKKFGIMVDTTRNALFAKQYNGYYAYIFNASGNVVNIEVQDGRLNMIMQVKVDDGWKDIEYIPSSWCGNSYYDVQLLDGEYWKLTIPKYDGEMEVEARLKFVVDDEYKDGIKLSETVLYSNIFKVKVNPGQFWNKQGYSPDGIMDPYFD